MIELLNPEKWPHLDEIFRTEWQSALPNPQHAQIMVEVEDEELLGFCLFESLVRVGNFYTAPNHRGNGTTRRLIKRVRQAAVDSGRSFIALADEKRYARLFQSLGMREVGMAYRKDYFGG